MHIATGVDNCFYAIRLQAYICAKDFVIDGNP